MAKFHYTVLSIPDRDIGRMFAALDRLGKSVDAAEGGPIAGTKCGATNIKGGNGNYDFNCKD